EPVQIDIALRNVAGYILGVSDHGRAWDYMYRCTQPELANTWVVEAKALEVDSAPYSLAAVKWFFERFGWTDANMAALEDAQAAFLKRRVRS
ncbi:MAG: hypothetical protein WCB05_17260, partial [Candidatus Sulfotelmatobacter sp.]